MEMPVMLPVAAAGGWNAAQFSAAGTYHYHPIHPVRGCGSLTGRWTCSSGTPHAALRDDAGSADRESDACALRCRHLAAVLRRSRGILVAAPSSSRFPKKKKSKFIVNLTTYE